MLNAARVLPAGPGEPDDDVFPLRERLRFRDNLGLALRDLRQRSAFAELAKGPWSLFLAIAVHWQSNAEAWPSQGALARFSGWSGRAVRDQTAMLERCGLIRLRRERRGDGSERIYYAPGPVTLAELAAFIERFPRDQARPRRPEAHTRTVAAPAAVLTFAHPSEPPAATPPEGSSMEHRDQDQIEPSSSCETKPATASAIAGEEQKLEITKEDREIARIALIERMARKHPARPPPRWFDAAELALVAACASALEGDRAAKAQSLSDAIAGAFVASKDGPPTARFIWGKLDHFLDHVERGHRRRLAEERNARKPAEEAATSLPPPTPFRWSPIPRAQMTADLKRLFGPGWKTNVPR